jgi:hypothetical protein
MRADTRFTGKNATYWAHAKFISEQIGYSKRGSGTLRAYSKNDARLTLEANGLSFNDNLLDEGMSQSDKKAKDDL